MDANCIDYTGGWMRVAYIDMRNSSHQCPVDSDYYHRAQIQEECVIGPAMAIIIISALVLVSLFMA